MFNTSKELYGLSPRLHATTSGEGDRAFAIFKWKVKYKCFIKAIKESFSFSSAARIPKPLLYQQTLYLSPPIPPLKQALWLSMNLILIHFIFTRISRIILAIIIIVLLTILVL